MKLNKTEIGYLTMHVMASGKSFSARELIEAINAIPIEEQRNIIRKGKESSAAGSHRDS